MIHDLFVCCLYIIVEDVEDTRTILYLCVFLLNHSHVGKNRLVERKLFTVQNPMPDTNREEQITSWSVEFLHTLTSHEQRVTTYVIHIPTFCTALKIFSFNKNFNALFDISG